MPDVLTSALQTDGLIWICLAALLASTVRGFAGFGTAMIYLPVVGQFLDPVSAILTLVVMDLFGPLPAVPRAIREADWPDLKRLIAAAAVTTVLGVWLLSRFDADMFRYVVSIATLFSLAFLVLGLRYSGRLTPAKVYGVGAGGGLLGGAAGLAGPPVILFYMASSHAPSTIRATIMLFLLGFDVIIFAVMGLQGLLVTQAIILGLILVPCVALGTVIGTALFDPARETLYRRVAYIIIGISAVRGLPIWG